MDGKNIDIYYHSSYRRRWQQTQKRKRMLDQDKDWIKYGSEQKIYIIEDFKKFLDIANMHPDNQELNKKIFLEQFVLNPAETKCLCIPEEPDEYTWYSSTEKGINLRPGRKEGVKLISDPIVMGGEESHAIIGGSTGSGKSVFLNNLILNMMLEYPPWELELYLADFKMLEFSKYMNGDNKAPHVRVCAATGEMDYVQSLIQYIRDKNQERKDAFTRLGFKKIEEFREYFRDKSECKIEVVLPRILFIIDEFQEMYNGINSYQKDEINNLLTNIIKQGRSQGVHLMFCSQEMGSALNSSQMNNFKLRFALRCDSNVSTDLIGNSAATDIVKGQVLLNYKSGNVNDNELFFVPLPENSSGKDYFSELLCSLNEYAQKYHYNFKTGQKYYNENQQVRIEKLRDFLNHPIISQTRMFDRGNDLEYKNKQKTRNFMSLVLGRKTLYRKENYDIENIFVEYGKNRNILCISTKNEDLAYFQKLMLFNMQTMNPIHNTYNDMNLPFLEPIFYDITTLVASFYPIKDRMIDIRYQIDDSNEKDIEAFEDRQIYYRSEQLNQIEGLFSNRENVVKSLRATNSLKEYLYSQLEYFMQVEDDVKRYVDDYREIIDIDLKGIYDNENQIEQFLESDLDYFGPLQDWIWINLRHYYRFKKFKSPHKIFRPVIVFLTGIENLDHLPNWFSRYLSSSMEYNILNVVCCSSSDISFEVRNTVNYVFVAGDDSKMFDVYYDKMPPKGGAGIKMFANIKNINQQFAFKKYLCEFNHSDPSINFDELLGEDF